MKAIGQMKTAGGTKADLFWAFCRGQCIIPKVPTVQLLRKAPVIQAILMASMASVVARVIAEELKTGNDGLKKLLQVKVNQIRAVEGLSAEEEARFHTESSVENRSQERLDDAVVGEGDSEPQQPGASGEMSGEIEDSPLLKELVGALKIQSKEKLDEVRKLLQKSEDRNSEKHLTLRQEQLGGPQGQVKYQIVCQKRRLKKSLGKNEMS